jgi:cell division septum initiation protein DivIVA
MTDDEMRATAHAYEQDKIERARSHYEQLVALAHEDHYRVPGCTDAITIDLARLLRKHSAESASTRFV